MNTAVSFVKRRRLRQQRFRYNATSTYARFSDVPTPYFAGDCRDAAAAADDIVVDRRMTSIRDRLLSKDRPVAWFATHCWTSSKRERYNIAWPSVDQLTHLSRSVPSSALVSFYAVQRLRAAAPTLLPNTLF